MKIARLFRGSLLATAFLVAGCVGTQVQSLTSTHGNAALERLLIVYRSGSVRRGGGPLNSAESLGNRNLGELVPHLHARLPLAFQAQGVQARMWVQPDLAGYSSRGGRTRYLLADLLDPRTKESLWRGQIRMGTPGFAKFDDPVVWVAPH